MIEHDPGNSQLQSPQTVENVYQTAGRISFTFQQVSDQHFIFRTQHI